MEQVVYIQNSEKQLSNRNTPVSPLLNLFMRTVILFFLQYSSILFFVSS